MAEHRFLSTLNLYYLIPIVAILLIVHTYR